MMLDHERATLELRRQHDHERAHHAVGLLGVLVRRKELARAVDQQVVELSAQRAALGQAEVAPDLRELRPQRPLPSPRVDLELARADLPAGAHALVEHRLVPEAVAGRGLVAGWDGEPGGAQSFASRNLASALLDGPCTRNRQVMDLCAMIVVRVHWPEICFLVGHEDTTCPARAPDGAAPGSGGASHRGVVRVAASPGSGAPRSCLVDLRYCGVGSNHSVRVAHRGIDGQHSSSSRVEQAHSHHLTSIGRTCFARSPAGRMLCANIASISGQRTASSCNTACARVAVPLVPAPRCKRRHPRPERLRAIDHCDLLWRAWPDCADPARDQPVLRRIPCSPRNSYCFRLGPSP